MVEPISSFAYVELATALLVLSNPKLVKLEVSRTVILPPQLVCSGSSLCRPLQCRGDETDSSHVLYL